MESRHQLEFLVVLYKTTKVYLVRGERKKNQNKLVKMLTNCTLYSTQYSQKEYNETTNPIASSNQIWVEENVKEERPYPKA